MLALLPGAACGSGAPPAEDERHPEVLVIVNEASPVSLAIGRAYLAQRGVPEENLLRLDLPLEDPTLVTPSHEVVSREVFERSVRDPVRAFLRERDPEGRISILVTTRGIPLRIAGAPGEGKLPWAQRTTAAVDAELARLDLDRSARGRAVASTPPGAAAADASAGDAAGSGKAAPAREPPDRFLGHLLPNPYHASDVPFAHWRVQHPEAPLRYLVARLTGYAIAPDAQTGVPRDVARLLANARAEGGGGVYVVDEDPTQPKGRDAGNRLLLAPAADAVRAAGAPLLHDTSADSVRDVPSIAGYASWGSNDRQTPPAPYYGAVPGGRRPGHFAPRAVVVDLVSFNARSFAYPPRYGQSLVADLVAQGAAGVAGHVDEPMLAGVARPHLLFAAWLAGTPAVEAYFRSLPYLGWTNLWVGDPLMQVEEPRELPADRDGDGVPDARDVCRVLVDPDQRDSDGDGFGNRCDADVDGDGRVDEADLARLGRAAATGLYVPAYDLDGDGEVDERDLADARLLVGLPPGPGQAESPRGR